MYTTTILPITKFPGGQSDLFYQKPYLLLKKFNLFVSIVRLYFPLDYF